MERSTRPTRKRTLRAAWPVFALTLLAGCPAGFNPGEEAYTRLFDYRIDRPRVMGLTVSPVYYQGGDTLTFEAFAATPENLVNPRIEWWGCGISIDHPIGYLWDDCLSTSIAEYLGEGRTLTYTLPRYDLTSCAATGFCYSEIPLYAIVRDEGGNPADDGYGGTALIPDLNNLGPPSDMVSDLPQAPVLFTLAGGASAQARPGEAVPLEVRTETRTDTSLRFTWYVSDGELEQLGLTEAVEVELGSDDAPNVIYGRNTLRLPGEIDADRVQVYVVIDSLNSSIYSYPAYPVRRFATGTVEVRR